MRAKRIAVVLIAVFFCFAFTGCSFFDFFGIESLLKPPKLTGENAALQQAFESAVGKNIVLFSPITGDFRSSYILFDYDGDGTDEAVVFYAQSENKSVVHMHLMAEDENGWYSVHDVIGNGTDIYKVDFFDLDNNNDKEIAVTWLQEDAKRDKTMSLYKIFDTYKQSESAVTSVATIQLVDYIYLDIDFDGINEILYFYFDSSEGKLKPCARLLELNSSDMTLVPVSNIELNPQISSFVQIISDKSDGRYRIYLDCIRNDSNYCTELILYDREKSVLVLPLSDGKKVSDLTLRTQNLMCTDFDKDGYVDIPSALSFSKPEEIKLENSGSTSETGKTLLVEWLGFRDEKLTAKGKYYINVSEGYSVNIDSFYDYSYVEYDSSAGLSVFRLYGDKKENVIFTVSCKKQTGEPEDVIQKKEYLITITAEGQALDITQESVRELIEDY